MIIDLLIGTATREAHSANHHSWGAVLWYDGEHLESPRTELNVLDRIGGCDGFAAGLIFGLLDGREPLEALKLGWPTGRF